MCEKSCLYCDCYDMDLGCTMSSIDKLYACPEYEEYTNENEKED